MKTRFQILAIPLPEGGGTDPAEPVGDFLEAPVSDEQAIDLVIRAGYEPIRPREGGIIERYDADDSVGIYGHLDLEGAATIAVTVEAGQREIEADEPQDIARMIYR